MNDVQLFNTLKSLQDQIDALAAAVAAIGSDRVTTVAIPLGASATTTSTVFTKLSGSGPSFPYDPSGTAPFVASQGLPDGVYLFVFGCKAKIGTAGETAFMTLRVNGVTSDANAAQAQSTNSESIVHAFEQPLDGVGDGTGGGNSVVAHYRSSNGAVTATFENRWAVAYRIADL